MLVIKADEIINFLKRNKYKRILLHGPDGLRNQMIKLLDEISSEISTDVFISGDRSFGACDIPFYEAKNIDADIIIHLGHTPFPYPKEIASSLPDIPVKYFQVYDNMEINENLYERLKKIIGPYEKIGVVFSIQYYNQFKHIVTKLKKNGWIVKVGKPYFNMMIDGQVLGCHVTSAKSISSEVDAFLVVSAGVFHALGVALWTGIPTYLVDLHTNKIINMDDETKRTRAIIAFKILQAEKARKIGVITSTRFFQKNIFTAKYVLKELRKKGKKGYLLILKDISPDNLMYFPSIDAFIQTACPRISIDDLLIYNKPLLNIEQFLILIDQKKFEEVYPWRSR